MFRLRTSAVPLLLFATVFVLSLSFALSTDPLPIRDDFLEYYRIAENIARGGGFTADGIAPNVYRPPLFSSLLGLWFFLTGSVSLRSVFVYQALCLGASVAFAYLLFRELFRDGRAATAAACVLAVHPSLVTSAVLVWQEPTILLATTAAAWQTVRWIQAPGRAGAALTGALWGLATLAKAVTAFVPLLLAVFWLLYRGRDRRLPLSDLGMAVLLFALVVAPWTARNYVHYQRLILVNDQATGIIEWNVQHSDPPSGEGTGPPALMTDVLRTKDASQGRLAGERFLMGLDAAGISGRERREAVWRYIRDHKAYFLAQRMRNAIYFASPTADWWYQTGRLKSGVVGNPAYWLFALVYFMPLYCALAWRALRLATGKDRSAPMSFLVLFYLAYWGVYTVLWGETRFGLPVYPILFTFAPWDRLVGRKHRQSPDQPDRRAHQHTHPE